MKKIFIKHLSLLFLFIALTAIYKPVMAQQNPPQEDSTGMGWIYDMYSPGGNFINIKNRAEQFFAAHPEYDTIAEFKNQYLDWLSYWKGRAHWADSATQPGDMGSALKAMSEIYTETTISNSGLPYQPSWKLKSPDHAATQNMGIVTCSWVDPTNIQNILIGTEASGLWESTDGGSTWKNKTENYLQTLSSTSTTSNDKIPIGFGVSSICVIKQSGNSRIIVISTYVPGTNLQIGHGLGILISCDNGNIWRKYLLTSSANYIQGIGNMNWKIINSGFVPSLSQPYYILYASYGEYIYKLIIYNNCNSFFSNLVFDIHNNVGLQNYHKQDKYLKTQKVREMKIVNENLVITTDGFFQEDIPVNIIANAQMFSAKLSNLENISSYSNNASWSHIDIGTQTSTTDFIDYIAIDEYNNNLFAAYDVIPINGNLLTDNETFHYEKYQLNLSNISSLQTQNSGTLSHSQNYELNSYLAGFGYRFHAFKVLTDTRFYIGGFQFNTCLLNTNSSTITVNLLPAVGLNAAHNNEYHYGIRDFAVDGQGDLYLATEGGITKYKGGVFYNINGNGLAIAQISSMTTTHNNKYDIIVNDAFRNGLWRYKCNNWDNFYWEDGGNVLMDEFDRDGNDNGEPDYIHNVTSHIFWEFHINPISNNHPYNYCTLNNCLTSSNPPIPDYLNLKEQGLLIPSSPTIEYNDDTPFEFSNLTNDDIYQGLHNIYKSSDYGASWSKITFSDNSSSLYNYPQKDYWAEKLHVIRVAPSNPDIMYIAFAYPTWDYNQNGNWASGVFPLHKIYRGEKQGGTWNWTDLSVDLGNYTPSDPGYILRKASISDIAVNPNNENEIWVTFDQFVGDNAINGKYRVMKGVYNTGTSACNWNDISNGLTCAPVNCIVYNKVTNNNELFVGTDAGVFYINNSLQSWQLFHVNNPKWIVTKLEINYNKMMLRAATWGRSIWETPIECSLTQPTDHPIHTSDTWNSPVYNCGNIVIDAGVSLTINADVEMAENASITVNKGAHLWIHNATIKSYCKEMWKGIIIDGDHTQPQTNTNSHGHVIINNSNIEDAITAIECVDLNFPIFGGGIVNGNHTTFRNNFLAVKMNPYAHWLPMTYKCDDNLSDFYYCNFIIDQPLKRPYDDLTMLTDPLSKNLVKISGIKGLRFTSCKFKNDFIDCNHTYNFTGINASNSSFYINPGCTQTLSLGHPCAEADIIPSEFTGLEYGIHTIGSIDNMPAFSIKNTVFNNKYGLYAYGCENFYLLSNKFYVPYVPNYWLYNQNPPKLFYGAYLDACIQNYHVEGNQFGDDNTNLGFIGLYVNNSSHEYKCIYNNTFNNLTYNFIARGNNGPNYISAYDWGLKIKCNEFNTSLYDVSVISDPNINPIDNGINFFQGNPTLSIPSAPAGNTFDAGSIHNFYNECSYVIYTSHNNPFTQPIVTNNLNGVTQVQPTLIQFNKQSACPDIDLMPVGNIFELPTEYSNLNAARQQLNSANLIYRIWVDGGNTEALQQAVNLALPYEAYELYNSLISSSPLSDEVMLSAIQNEDVLPPLMLKMVMLANPQAIKSPRIMAALYARTNPFPQEWIDELKLQGVGTVSAREQLESEIDNAGVNKQIIFNRIVTVYTFDTTATYTTDSLIALYRRENSFETDVDLIYFYINHNMPDEAYQLREQIGSKYTIGDNNQEYWQDTYIITRLLTNLKYTDKTIYEMDENNRTELYEILNHTPSKAVSIARMLLMQTDTNFVYEEIVALPPEIRENKASKPKEEKQKLAGKLEVFPNPANDFVTLTYQTDESLIGLRLIICDAAGKTVYTQSLNKPKDYLLIVLKNYAKGNYIAGIINKEKTIKTCKFVVQ